jgi:hypothetical protein
MAALSAGASGAREWRRKVTPGFNATVYLVRPSCFGLDQSLQHRFQGDDAFH